MLALGVQMLVGAAAPAASAAPACPTNPPMANNNASCEAFCAGRCAYHPDFMPDGQPSAGAPTNLTVYRLTAEKMLKYGVGNKDTGDAAGDVGFYMGRFMSLVDCKPPWTSHGCFLDEQPVIQEFTLETDGMWGPYMKCNPLTDPGTNQPILDQPFLCNYGNAGPGGPPQPPPVDPEHWVQKGGCGCARSNITVGVDPAREQSGWGSLVPGR